MARQTVDSPPPWERVRTKTARLGRWPGRLYSRVVKFRLWILLVSKSIEVLGFGLAGFFVALVLMNSGLSLAAVGVFYLCYAACAAVIVGTIYGFLLRATRRRGCRIGMTIGTIASSAYMLGVAWYASSPHQLWLLCLLPVLMAAQDAFLWPSEHIYTAFVINEQRQGGSLAAVEIARRIVVMLAPLIGGHVAAWWGQTWLSAIAALVILARLVPIRQTQDVDYLDVVPHNDLRPRFKAVPWRDLIAQLGFSGHAVTAPIIWPVYIAMSLGSFTLIGVVASGATLVSIAVLMVVGWIVDQRKKNLLHTFRMGTTLVSTMHLARLSALFVAGNPWVIGGIIALYDACLQCQYLPWSDSYYAQVRQRGVGYALAREVVGFAAYLPMFAVLVIVTFAVGGNAAFAAVFVLAASLTWLCLCLSMTPQNERTA